MAASHTREHHHREIMAGSSIREALGLRASEGIMVIHNSRGLEEISRKIMEGHLKTSGSEVRKATARKAHKASKVMGHKARRVSRATVRREARALALVAHKGMGGHRVMAHKARREALVGGHMEVMAAARARPNSYANFQMMSL